VQPVYVMLATKVRCGGEVVYVFAENQSYSGGYRPKAASSLLPILQLGPQIGKGLFQVATEQKGEILAGHGEYILYGTNLLHSGALSF
jgi:hypothetical protein